ncbi:hypothetical protein MTR67_000195 [Solanum verrucosum]|uniref:Uncharacterized protein n=1 Tax=Solanum verrucosum TaxID=315347 RepID=A0AAF0PPM3_SOLVR|nr:hypothetical protein MTR67_000195 [Solanum verrucosum]
MQKRLDFYHNYSIRILDSLFTHLHKEEKETWGGFDLVFQFYDIVFSAPLRERGEGEKEERADLRLGEFEFDLMMTKVAGF